MRILSPRKRTGGLLLAAAAAIVVQAATPASFEVASIKPAAPQGEGRMMTMMRGGPGTGDPGQMTWTNASLMILLTTAYDVSNFQIAGPSWLDSERFDVTATLPPGTTKDQSHVMLQNLLAERFHLALHRESKDVQGYELVSGKSGAKLQVSAAEADSPQSGSPAPDVTGPPKTDANGFPRLDHAGIVAMIQLGPKGPVVHMTGRSQPVSELARMMSDQLRSPVVDRTGKAEKYDFTLEFAPDMGLMGPMPAPPPGGREPAPAGDDSTPTLLTAVQEQLGLKLEAKKVPVQTLIVDQIDKVPAVN